MNYFSAILLSVILTAIAYMAFPLIRMLINHGKFERKRAKKIALWNSIIVGFVFCILTLSISGGRAWSAAPAFLYYCINCAILTDKTITNINTDAANSGFKRNFKCGKCGKIGPYDGNCPDCNSSMKVYFDEEIIQENVVINTIPNDDKFEKCEMCDQLTDNLVSVKIVDSMGTRYRKLCPNCITKYNAKTDDNQSAPGIVGQESERKPMFCRICGAKLITDSLFCSKCGTKVEEADSNANTLR